MVFLNSLNRLISAMEKRYGRVPLGRDALSLGERVLKSHYLKGSTIVPIVGNVRSRLPNKKRHIPPDMDPQPCRSENPGSQKAMFPVRYRPNVCT
jgi:hypothetical protein